MRHSHRRLRGLRLVALSALLFAPADCVSENVPRTDADPRPDAPMDDAAPDDVMIDPGQYDDAPSPLGSPYVTPVDDAMAAHVRSVLALGAAMGNRPNVFSKIGDSITESEAFLTDFGQGWDDLGGHASLQPTIAYFSTVMFADASNSFDRASECATPGWTSADAITGGASSPLVTELLHTRPAYAIVMYGTNDLDHGPIDTFVANMQMLVGTCEQHGVVPILSTIPDRADAPDKEPLVLQFNAAIRTLAANHHIPMIDFWAALQSLPGHGLSSDGVHPNVYMMGDAYFSCYFTGAGMQYGYNVRNLTALEALDLMHRTFP